MPIREYRARDPGRGCRSCAPGFEKIESLKDPPLERCPDCGAALERVISAPSVGASRSGADDRAKAAGFHKLKKISKGEYEKIY